MLASLRALLTGILDYAGLFPPAKLPLEEAIRNYARYRTGAMAWMLGRFICPAARLAELTPFVEEMFAVEHPLALTVLASGGNSLAEFHVNLDADLQELMLFRQRHGRHVTIDLLETRLPAEGLPTVVSGGETRELIEQTANVLDAVGGLTLFVEVPTGPHWNQVAAATIEAIRGVNARREPLTPEPSRIGFKMRCGGLVATAIAPADHVARALNSGLPVKATAGLHHPFPQRDESLGATTHGFLNVFVAGALTYVHHLKTDTLTAILRDEHPDHFVFDEDGVHWGDWYVTTDEVRAARRQGILSFGSCSFEEPQADLHALGLL